MNIKELKEKIKDLPDDMIVGGSGHYGEFLDCNSIYVDSNVGSATMNFDRIEYL